MIFREGVVGGGYPQIPLRKKPAKKQLFLANNSNFSPFDPFFLEQFCRLSGGTPLFLLRVFSAMNGGVTPLAKKTAMSFLKAFLIQGVFFSLVSPRKVLIMEPVPPNS